MNTTLLFLLCSCIFEIFPVSTAPTRTCKKGCIDDINVTLATSPYNTLLSRLESKDLLHDIIEKHQKKTAGVSLIVSVFTMVVRKFPASLFFSLFILTGLLFIVFIILITKPIQRLYLRKTITSDMKFGTSRAMYFLPMIIAVFCVIPCFGAFYVVLQTVVTTRQSSLGLACDLVQFFKGITKGGTIFCETPSMYKNVGLDAINNHSLPSILAGFEQPFGDIKKAAVQEIVGTMEVGKVIIDHINKLDNFLALYNHRYLGAQTIKPTLTTSMNTLTKILNTRENVDLANNAMYEETAHMFNSTQTRFDKLTNTIRNSQKVPSVGFGLLQLATQHYKFAITVALIAGIPSLIAVLVYLSTAMFFFHRKPASRQLRAIVISTGGLFFLVVCALFGLITIFVGITSSTASICKYLEVNVMQNGEWDDIYQYFPDQAEMIHMVVTDQSLKEILQLKDNVNVVTDVLASHLNDIMNRNVTDIDIENMRSLDLATAQIVIPTEDSILSRDAVPDLIVAGLQIKNDIELDCSMIETDLARYCQKQGEKYILKIKSFQTIINEFNALTGLNWCLPLEPCKPPQTSIYQDSTVETLLNKTKSPSPKATAYAQVIVDKVKLLFASYPCDNGICAIYDIVLQPQSYVPSMYAKYIKALETVPQNDRKTIIKNALEDNESFRFWLPLMETRGLAYHARQFIQVFGIKNCNLILSSMNTIINGSINFVITAAVSAIITFIFWIQLHK